MPIVSFYTKCKKECGNTVSAISFATYLGIEKNKKILFVSTSFNDDTIKDAFWEKQNKKKSGVFGPNTNKIAQNGIEALELVIRSNRITPEIITDYTQVVLTGRLEILMGYTGDEEQYLELQQRYPEIIALATKCYDMVIVDVDKRLDEDVQTKILNLTDVVIAMTTQKTEDLHGIIDAVTEKNILKPNNTLLALGKYDDRLKYNAKNITRSFSKRKELINTIPYNYILYEAIQNGKIIDAMLNFLTIKNNEENVFFVEELKRLSKAIDDKHMELQMKS